MNEPFSDVIGQDEIKRKLKFYLDSYHKTQVLPNLLFSGQKGGGKTMFALKTAEQLVEYSDKKPVLKSDGVSLKKKPLVPLNAASIPSFKWLAERVIVPHCLDKQSTVFIDECSELKEEVASNLLSLLSPNVNNRNSILFEEMNLDIDFRNNTFIFATTNVEKMNQPLVDRLMRLDLESYTMDDLGKVVQRSAPNVEFIEDVLSEIASVVRGNCRQAVKMASDIKSYLTTDNKFGKTKWTELKKILSIHKYGLTQMEIDILKILRDKPEGSSLTNLSAKTGIARTALQKDYEMMLQRYSLMDIRQQGRVITSKGIEYLKEMEACPA